MALTTEGFESGSNGSAVTTGNSAFSAVTSGVTFSNANVFRGNLSAKIDSTTGAGGRYCRKDISSTAVALRQYINLASLSAADERVMSLLDSTGATHYAYVVLQGTGRIRFGCTGSSSTWTATNQYPTSQWLRVEMYAVAGSTTSNGIASVAYYDGHDTTPMSGGSFSASNLNIGGGGATFGRAHLGKLSGTLASDTYFDDMAIDDAATGLIGPSVLPSFTWAYTIGQG